jgi:hypothetical protein
VTTRWYDLGWPPSWGHIVAHVCSVHLMCVLFGPLSPKERERERERAPA